jgi:predicted ATPase
MARAGQGQLLFVIGGAGRGKTLLVQEFAQRAQVADPDLIVVSGNCNAHTGLGDPYLPFRELLVMLTGDVEAKWAGRLISREHARRLWNLIPITIAALVEHASDLIGSFVPAKALQARAATFASKDIPWFTQLTTFTAATDPRAKLEQQNLFAQYAAVLKVIAIQRPILLILEDLQWIDGASSDLLFHLSRQVSDSRILIVGTYRPDELVLSGRNEQHPLTSTISELKRQHGDIWLDLGDLAPKEGQHFVEAYLDTQPNRLDAAFRRRLFQHTDGHALFTVELLRELQERGDLRQDKDGYWLEGDAIDWQTLPAKVEGVIERRINHLTEELQAVLTVASVEGEIFTAEVVAQVQQLNDRGLVRQLSQALGKRHRLITAQALERVGGQRLSRYRFRHHLFQHYLYHHLDEMERVYLHEAVGNALESLYGDQTEQAAVQLARHFEQAGLMAKAVDYLLQAGKQAVQLSAYKEAVAHLTKGIELLKTFPTTPESMRYELDIQMTLGRALIAKGYASPEVRQAYTRARVLCRQVGQKLELFEILGGLSNFYRTRGELQTARELAEERLDLAQQMDDPFLLREAHYTLGHSLYLIGELILAQTHLEQGLALDIPQQHRSLTSHFWDERPYCLSRLAQVLWLLGYPEQALEKSREALIQAQELSRPLVLAYILNDTAEFRLLRGEGGAVQDQIDTTLKLCHEYEFRQMLSWATFLQGSALVAQGQVEQGISQQYQGCEAYQAVGGKVRMSRYLAMVAEAHKIRGQFKEGLRLVAEGFAVMRENGEHFSEAELYRVKGELLIQAEAKAEEEIENYYLKAIEVACQQEAKSLELRAVMSLSRLWQKQGKKNEARQMLEKIYGWFTEGFDTADLKEAGALLKELS